MRLKTLRHLLFACAFTIAAPLHAAPSAADVETARNLMDVGRVKYDDGDYAGALESFQGADALVGVTSTGLWVGKALLKLGRLIEARDKLYQVSQIPPAPEENDVLREARSEASELQRALADRIPVMTLVIDGLAEGAQASVLVDGDVVEPQTLQLPRKVDPGEHVVRATAQGYHDVEVSFSIRETERQTITLVFTPRGEPIPKPSGGISPLVWAGVAVAGAGVVVGAITGGISLADAADAKSLCGVDDGRCNEPTGSPLGDDAKKKADRSLVLAHVSTASFAVAGAGAALMVVGFIMGNGDKQVEQATVTPLVGPGFVGLHGTF